MRSRVARDALMVTGIVEPSTTNNVGLTITYHIAARK
jgi:hypothetical protein